MSDALCIVKAENVVRSHYVKAMSFGSLQWFRRLESLTTDVDDVQLAELGNHYPPLAFTAAGETP